MITYLVGGWYTYPSEKWWSGVKVSCDFSFPTEWKVIKFHGSSHHQPDGISWYIFWDFAGWIHGNGPVFHEKSMEKGGVQRSSRSKVWNSALQTTKNEEDFRKQGMNGGWRLDVEGGFRKSRFITEGCGERKFTIKIWGVDHPLRFFSEARWGLLPWGGSIFSSG